MTHKTPTAAELAEEIKSAMRASLMNSKNEEEASVRIDQLVARIVELEHQLASLSSAQQSVEAVAWRTRFRSEPGMIGHYPWSFTERKPSPSTHDAYEVEPLYTRPQQVALTVAKIHDAADKLSTDSQFLDGFYEGACFAEREHGIGGAR